MARDYIKHNFPDIHVYKYPEDVPNYEMVDILLSIDSAEHMECPITELREMAKRVRKGGKVVSYLIFEWVDSVLLFIQLFKLQELNSFH